MYRFLCFIVLFFLQSLSLFAKEDGEKYLSHLKDQLQSDMEDSSHLQNRATELSAVEAGKAVYTRSTSKGSLEDYFTTIAEVNSPLVDYYIRYYTTFGKRKLEDLLDRFRDYFPVIRKYAKKHGLPNEVALIPLAESGIRIDTVRDRRAGMWLLSEDIAKIYNLRIGEYLDERFDLEKSTNAALNYFSSLLKAFNDDWDFALTAFNGGGIVLQKEIRTLGVENFWELYDKKAEVSESLEYVPKFYALLTILKHPSQYSLRIPDSEEGAVSFEELPLVKSGVAFKDIARMTNVSMDKIISLNPHLSRQYTVAGATLYIPANTQYLMKSRIRVAKAIRLRYLSYGRGDGSRLSFRSQDVRIAKVGRNRRKKTLYYRVKSKDTLYSIAKRMGVSVQSLISGNKNLSIGSVLKVGRLIKVARLSGKRGGHSPIHYTVKSGDTLYSIAKNYNVPLSRLVSKNGASIRPGDDVIIKS